MTKLKQLLTQHKEACLEIGFFGTGEKLAEAEQAIEDYVGQAMIDAIVYGKRAVKMSEDAKIDEWDRLVGKWASLT